MRVRILEKKELGWWYNDLLCEDFPENERKPLQPFWMETCIRPASLDDLPRIMEIESDAFPPEEAAEADTFRFRMEYFGEWFYVALQGGIITGAVNGRLTDKTVIDDTLYEPVLQNKGDYFALLSVETETPYRRQGIAEALIHKVIHQATEHDLKGIILACKEEKISYYEKFGFIKNGVSLSVHGGAIWYDMILKLDKQV